MSIICPACESNKISDKKYVFSTTRGTDKAWARCNDCKAYFIIDDFSASTETSHGTTTSYGSVERGIKTINIKNRLYQQILKFVTQYRQNKDNKWLDIGCSFGGLIELASKNGFDVKGIDILPQVVEYLKSKGYNVSLSYSVGNLDTAEKFDIVTSIDSHYYWPKQRSEIQFIHNHLNDNGIIVFRTSNKTWLVSLGLIFKQIFPGIAKKMIMRGLNDHRFSVPFKSLLLILKDEGFKIEHISIKDAYFSNNSSFLVKAGFYASAFIYTLSGIFIAPGAIIIARKI